MEKLTANLEAIAEVIRQDFSAKDAAREKALRFSRETIRHSSNAIRAVHRGEFSQAQSFLDMARQLLDEVDNIVAPYHDILSGGFIHDAKKEYAEGCLTLAAISGNPLSTPEELRVSHAAYLNGLGEAAGELRRHLLDSIRRGNLSSCEQILSVMDDIYGVLVTMDYPDALTYGLRRTTDMVRGVLEKTRGDLTLALRQKELEQLLAGFNRERKLES